MSQVLRAQATINRSTLVSGDKIVNTFHFIEDTDGDVAALAAANIILGKLVTFYTAIDGHISNLMEPLVSFKVYTLAHPIPRAPLTTGQTPLTLSISGPLPAEVACCLSYRAASESGVPVSRTRGRIFIGPLTQAAVTAAVGGDVRPNTTLQSALRNAGLALGAESPGDPEWCVWSPTSLTARPVIEVSTDDAFDIQRSRGAKPTVRLRSII